MPLLKRKRYSIGASLLAAVAMFPLIALLSGWSVRAVVIVIGDALPAFGMRVGPTIDIIMGTILIGAPMGFAYLAARATFMSMRWELVDVPEGAVCTRCGYDLTGNVSGRCPECGQATAREVARDTKRAP